MTIFDLSLILILIGFTINGLFKGLIKMLGSIASFFVAVFVAGHFHIPFYNWFSSHITGNESFLKIVSFIILFFVASKLCILLFRLIEKLFNIIAFIPGTKLINNLLGGAFGLILGLLVSSLAVFILSSYLDIGGSMSNLIINSYIAPSLLQIANVYVPLLPEAFKTVNSVINERI